MALAHVGLGLQRRDPQLDLVDLLADVLAGQLAELDLQAVQLEQHVGRVPLLLLVVLDQLEEQPRLLGVLVLDGLLQQHEVRLHSDLRVEQRDELQQVLLDVPVVVGPEDGDDGFDGVFGVLLLLVELRDALDGGPEAVQSVILAVDLQQLTQDLDLIVLEVVFLGSRVELL